MGVIDAEGKKYFSNNKIFADAFNYLIYDGEQVIQADKLREIDTAEQAIPYGNGTKAPTQKYRDILKLWNVMTDDKAVYVVLGVELQDKVHYGMPVKNGLYDFLGYSKQIEEIKHSFGRKKKSKSGGGFVAEEETLKIKLTSEEFLSGLRKNDKLMPIITVVFYLGDKPWDGPKSLHDMLNIHDDFLRKYVPDYRINLISPLDMDDEEFAKFKTDLGFAMNIIKHQSDSIDKIIGDTKGRTIDRDTAIFVNTVSSLKLEYEEEKGDVNMCLAMEKKEKRDRIIGTIEGFRHVGMSETDIIEKIIKMYQVTREYVCELLAQE
jgi:hypothetical protein